LARSLSLAPPPRRVAVLPRKKKGIWEPVLPVPEAPVGSGNSRASCSEISAGSALARRKTRNSVTSVTSWSISMTMVTMVASRSAGALITTELERSSPTATTCAAAAPLPGPLRLLLLLPRPRSPNPGGPPPPNMLKKPPRPLVWLPGGGANSWVMSVAVSLASAYLSGSTRMVETLAIEVSRAEMIFSMRLMSVLVATRISELALSLAVSVAVDGSSNSRLGTSWLTLAWRTGMIWVTTSLDFSTASGSLPCTISRSLVLAESCATMVRMRPLRMTA